MEVFLFWSHPWIQILKCLGSYPGAARYLASLKLDVGYDVVRVKISGKKLKADESVTIVGLGDDKVAANTAKGEVYAAALGL
jgi:hypothetical protein